MSTNCSDVEYSFGGKDLQNAFGCNALKKKSYCILNKQYTKEKYEELVLKIKKHMNDMPYVDKKGRVYKYGEFFPIEFAPFAYNQTNAQEFFPLEKKEIEDFGFRFKEVADKDYIPTITEESMPVLINDVPDSFTKEIIGCAEWGSQKSKIQNCTKAFRVTENELNFYKQHNLPLPHKCPNCRHFDRIKRRNSITLYDRGCMKCNIQIKTSYAPDRPEIVYCEKCYQQEVY